MSKRKRDDDVAASETALEDRDDSEAAYDVEPEELQKALETMQVFVHLKGVGPCPYALSTRTAEQYEKLPPNLAKYLESDEISSIVSGVKSAEEKNRWLCGCYRVCFSKVK